MSIRESLHELVPRDAQERVMATNAIVNTFGNGLFSVTSALYFTRVVGLTPAQLGLAFSVSAAIGLTVMLPMGHLADLYSPKRLSRMLTVVAALAMIGYAFAHTFATFFAAAIVIAITDRGANAVRGALIARVGGPDGKVRMRAYLRAITNLGIALGSLVGGAALVVDAPWFYRALILTNAGTSLLAAWILRWLPDIPPIKSDTPPRRTEALRDRTYVALVGLNSVLSTHFLLLELIIPLWIVRETAAPRWLAAGTYLVNTIACTLFQVRAARGAEDIPTAARIQRSGAGLLGVGALVYAVAAVPGVAWIAAVLLLAGAAVHVAGELKVSSGSFGIGFGLPPEHLQGQYQGVWSLGFGFSTVMGPALLTTLLLHFGYVGWFALAVSYWIAGLATPRLVASALRDPRRVA